MTGLTSFLSDGTPGSSGLMIAEYVAQDALASVRTQAVVVSGHSVSISLGAEEHASYASQGARQLRQIMTDALIILAVEAVAAVRALSLAPSRILSCPARKAFDLVSGVMDPDLTDRPFGSDVTAVLELMPELARLCD